MSIEEEFFKTFGIKKQKEYGCTDTWDFCLHQREYPNCKGCPFWEIINTEYPRITDRILLELICVHSTYSEPRLCATNIEAIKRQVLRDLINDNEEENLKQQVRSLFKEEE